nr:intermediate cleaving peptidase 55 [Quercus suber]
MRTPRIQPCLRALSLPTPAFRTRPPHAASRFTPASRRSLVSAAHCKFGQPLHETHPHLIRPTELTPGITALDYHHRRAALASKLPRNSIAILKAADVKWRSNSVFHDYRQESNFFYLTGVSSDLHPHEIHGLTFARAEKGRSDVEYTFHLFVRPKNKDAERWSGARSGVQAAQDVFNADEAGDIDSVAVQLPKLIESARTVFTDIGYKTSSRESGHAFGEFIKGDGTCKTGFIEALERTRSTVRRLSPIMDELRIVKSDAELKCMRKAASVSGAVFTEAMRNSYTTEKQLGADLAYGFRTGGLDGEAYVPVIGGGQNALCIHYVANNEELHAGDLVLVDAGGEYGGYITDITRTWPVNGRFTDAQRDLYRMILEVQESCISRCHASADLTLNKLHHLCEDGLHAGLKDLGFDMSRSDALSTLFPHHVGHYIGLDIHDTSSFPKTHLLQRGNCVTVEPGIYVPDDARWPQHFRGMGIRIEDSVVVGQDDVEVLTHTAIKGVDEIEALRK